MCINVVTRLSPEGLEELSQLTLICDRHEGLHLDLGWEALMDDTHGTMRVYTCHEEGAIIGAAVTFRSGAHEAEVSGMVHPGWRRRGVFTGLLARISRDCEDVESLLLTVDGRSTSGASLVSSLGAVYSRSEYRMECVAPVEPSPEGPAVRLELASFDDIPELMLNQAACFGTEDEDLACLRTLYEHRLASPKCLVYRAVLETSDVQGPSIGQVTISFEAKNPYVYGLAVHPNHQRKGYGRAVLAEALRLTRGKSPGPVGLDVACDNPRALQLYKACGFVEVSTYNYHALDIRRKPTARAEV